MLTQLGFAVAIGILFAAFVMAMLLVPSLTALIGTRAWWPGHGADPTPDLDAGVTDAELEKVH
jgi:RND superfamily putative drug exporter